MTISENVHSEYPKFHHKALFDDADDRPFYTPDRDELDFLLQHDLVIEKEEKCWPDGTPYGWVYVLTERGASVVLELARQHGLPFDIMPQFDLDEQERPQ